MSFEAEIGEKIAKKEKISNRLNIPILKYFWQASPLSGGGEGAIPKFLRKIEILKNFSNNELRILSGHLHVRHFASQEAIFNQNDSGVGFYFIFSGQVEIWAAGHEDRRNRPKEETKSTVNALVGRVVTLEKKEHFGELALLKENAIRMVSAVAKTNSELLGIFKPDLEELINHYPIVGAKLLHSISLVLADRLSLLAEEARILRNKIFKLEMSSGNQK